MSQSRAHSMIEAWCNVLVGFGVAYASNVIVLPLFGLPVTASDAFGIGLVYTGISLVRSYALRRLFNRWHRQGAQ